MVLSTTLVYSQDSLLIWGNYGFGIINHHFDINNAGLSINYGINIRYDRYFICFKLIDNTDISILAPEYKLITREVLVGYTIPILTGPKLFELAVCSGIGSAEEINPQYVSSNGLFETIYKNTSRNSVCLPIEIRIESRFKHVLGASIALYSAYGSFYPVHGVSFNILLGYW
jgi:hypothetical protein